MALTKITSAIIADGAITASAITNTSITADKLHTTLDLTGKAVTVATATAGDNDTTVASTAFVSTAIANLADSAPSTLDTLNELAAALGDDANFSTTVTNSIAAKLPLAGGTMTGTIAGFTSTGIDDNATSTAMTINSSENVLVGKTADTYSVEGIALRGNPASAAALATFTRTGANPISLNRLSNDGDMLVFTKDGTIVGNIGTEATDIYIGTTDTGIRFNDAVNGVLPYHTSSGQTDNTLDLGFSSVRWKDLHLAGIASIGNLKIGTDQGTDGQVLTSTGSGIAWEDVSSGGTTINNNADNRIITGSGTANTLNGESGLTYDGSTLAVTGAITSDSTITSLTNFNSTSGNDLRLNAGSANRDIFMQVNGSTLMTVKGSTGNVGIGTTSPNQDGFGSTSRVLTVKAASSGGTGALELIGLANSSGDLMSAINFMSYTLTSPAARITAVRHNSDTEASIAFDTSGAERMRIASDGVVYFGPNGSTADPRINRHSNGYDYINSGDSRWLKIGASSGHTNVAFQDGSGGVTVFETAGSERMRITNTGIVQISQGLSHNSTNACHYFGSTTGFTGVNPAIGRAGGANFHITGSAAGDLCIGGEAGNSIIFGTSTSGGPAERMRIASNGETTITGPKMNVISSAEAVMGAEASGNSYWRVVADNSPNTYFQAGTGQTSSQVKMYFTGMYGSNNTMTVDTPNSRVGIGTTSPGKKLDVRGTIRATAAQNDISLSDELPGYGANSYGNLKASANNIYLAIGGSYIGYINGSAQLNASDSRLKENVATLTGALDKVNQLRGVSFNWIDSARGEGTHIGFIAQELEAVYPELVGDGGLPDDDDGQSAIKSVDYGHMVPVLVEAIKELKAENDALRARLDAGGL